MINISEIKRIVKTHPKVCAFATYLGMVAYAIAPMFQPDKGPEYYVDDEYLSYLQYAYGLTDGEALGLIAHVLSKVKGLSHDGEEFHAEWLDPQDPFVLAFFGPEGTWLKQVAYVRKTF